MALAILEFLAIDNKAAKFRIDTGTNGYYYVKIGRAIGEGDGMKWVDDVTSKTPLSRNQKSGALLSSATEIAVPSKLFNRDDCYAQLFSFKNTEGKSPAFSKVIKVPVALKIDIPTRDQDIYSLSTSVNSYQMSASVLNPHRNIPHIEPASDFSTQASYADLLSEIIKVAGPIVVGIVSGIEKNNEGNPAAAGATKTDVPQVGMFNTILDALLQAISPAKDAPQLSAPKSITTFPEQSNRFMSRKNKELAKPFIFGIDDALLATLAAPIISSVAGPLLQMVPQLIGADNPHKLQQEQADNKFITDVLSENNRDALLKQFLGNQPQSNGSAAAPAGIDMNQLMKLLQQQGANNNAAVSVTKSIGRQGFVTILSTDTVLSFDLSPGITVNGKSHTVFSKKSGVLLKLKRNVVNANDNMPLPKAIIKFCFKDKKHKVVLEKIFKQKDIKPGAVLEYEFSAEEINKLPANQRLQVYAEMKWLTSGNVEVKALGATELIFATDYILREQGKEMAQEKEPIDMKVYRSFWNKLWESPVAANSSSKDDSVTKYRWELDATVKYCMLLSTKNDSNGLMDTKRMFAQSDPEDLTEKMEGKMKGGIEISITELNKLASLWNRQPLNEEQLSALKNRSIVHKNSGEFVYRLQLKGMRKERGLVWIVPVLKLYEFNLGKISKINEAGQVQETEEEKVMLPVPVAARVIGLKSGEGSSNSVDSSDYHFEGFSVMVNEKISLTPVQWHKKHKNENYG
jgi:hypothetical protein